MVKKLKVRIKEKPVTEKKIDTEFIRLDAFNGEVCTSRGKKLRPGDTAEFEHKIYKVI